MDNMIVLKIKDRKYGMRKMPPLKGSAFGIKVASMVSKVVSGEGAMKSLQALKEQFAGVTGKEKTEIDAGQAMTLGASVVGLLSNVNPDELTAIFKEAFSYEVYFENSKLSDELNFDLHFQKYPGDLYVVALWATYNHVSDFFAGIGDGLKALLPSSVDQGTAQV